MKALIATDGTPHAIEAAHRAVGLLRPDLAIEIVRVIPAEEDPNDTAGGFEGPVITLEEAEERHHLDEAQAHADLEWTLAAAGEPATITVLEGDDPGRAICDLAAARGIDVLVVGASDKGWFRRIISGSVMEYAAHHAPCPLLIIRHSGEPQSAA
jgi:nucleotide-binding universal stress UspA family protein